MSTPLSYSEGRTAPASIKKPFGHKYRWLVNGNIYEQIDSGISNNWVLEDPSGIEFLNDLADVTVPLPSPGDILSWNGSGWVNAPLSVDVPLGNSLYVSSKGISVFNGAKRESIKEHFSSLTEAVGAAQFGDTVYVYGDHTLSTNLAKPGVKYHFFGNGTITGTTNMIDDLGGASGEIYIRGNAKFRNVSYLRVPLTITGPDTKFDIECYSIVQQSGATAIEWQGGTDDSRLVVEQDIDNTQGKYTIHLQGVPRGTIEARRDIDNSGYQGGERGTIFSHGISTEVTIKGTIRQNSSLPYSTINSLSYGNSGTLNIIGDVYSHPSNVIRFFGGEGTVQFRGGKLVITGDIYSDARPAYYAFDNANYKHVGNLYTAFPSSSIEFQNPTTPTFNFHLIGDVYATASACPLLTYQTGGSFRHEGKVYNSFNAAGAGSVARALVTAGGTGYPTQSITNNVATTALTGVGTGLTLYVDNNNTVPSVKNVMIYNPGSGYVAGDTVQISGLGNGDAVVTIQHVGVSGIVLKNVYLSVLTTGTLVGGTGYTNPGANGIATSGGTGTGLVIDYLADVGGAVTGITIVNPGSGYTVTDIITILDGNNDATFTVNSVNLNNYDAIFDNSLIVIDEAFGDESSIAGYPANKNIIITEQIAGNKPASNITNLVTGSSEIYDSNIK